MFLKDLLFSLMPFFLIALICTNVAAFAAFGFDKRLAQNQNPRISEASLLLLVILGGGIGAVLGQQHFRHKTKKQPFKIQMWSIIVFQIGIAGYAIYGLAI